MHARRLTLGRLGASAAGLALALAIYIVAVHPVTDEFWGRPRLAFDSWSPWLLIAGCAQLVVTLLAARPGRAVPPARPRLALAITALAVPAATAALALALLPAHLAQGDAQDAYDRYVAERFPTAEVRGRYVSFHDGDLWGLCRNVPGQQALCVNIDLSRPEGRRAVGDNRRP